MENYLTHIALDKAALLPQPMHPPSAMSLLRSWSPTYRAAQDTVSRLTVSHFARAKCCMNSLTPPRLAVSDLGIKEKVQGFVELLKAAARCRPQW